MYALGLANNFEIWMSVMSSLDFLNALSYLVGLGNLNSRLGLCMHAVQGPVAGGRT
jgi:hypothetical protein